jgi:hypothetical protein
VPPGSVVGTCGRARGGVIRNAAARPHGPSPVRRAESGAARGVFATASGRSWMVWTAREKRGIRRPHPPAGPDVPCRGPDRQGLHSAHPPLGAAPDRPGRTTSPPIPPSAMGPSRALGAQVPASRRCRTPCAARWSWSLAERSDRKEIICALESIAEVAPQEVNPCTLRRPLLS